MSIDALIEEPSEYDFYQAVYTLQRQLDAGKEQFRKVGFDSLPKNELIRFKADQHLGFPGQAITKVKRNDTDEHSAEHSASGLAVDMHVSFMGLTGPSGVLPQHYSELILQRIKYKDTGMRDFYDVFNHRLISLFYRAWEKYRFAINFQSDSQANSTQKTDAFTQVLSKLSGGTGISQYYAGIFSKSMRSAEGLQQILAEFTGCQVAIEQFQGKWQSLSSHEQTRLGQRSQPEGQYACLGVDASIGSRVWDINSSIAINIKPGLGTELKAFLPGQSTALGLKQLIKSYLGDAITFKINLEIKQGDVPPAQLSRKSVPLGLGCGLLSRPENSTKNYTLSLS